MKLAEFPSPGELRERSQSASLAAKAVQAWHSAEADAVEAKRLADVAAEAAETALEDARKAFALVVAPFTCDVAQPISATPADQASTTVSGAPLGTSTGLPEADPATLGASSYASRPPGPPPGLLLRPAAPGTQARNGAGGR